MIDFSKAELGDSLMIGNDFFVIKTKIESANSITLYTDSIKCPGKRVILTQGEDEIIRDKGNAVIEVTKIAKPWQTLV